MATWTGAVNQKWSEPMNWDTSAVPTSSEYVSFYGVPDVIVDIDIDVNVDYLNLSSNILSFNMNDKTIQCNQLHNSTSALSVVNCGTSTLVIGSSANAQDKYTYADIQTLTPYKLVTFNKCTLNIAPANSLFDTSGCTKIIHSLTSHNIVSISTYYTKNVCVLDCPLIDLSDCIILDSSSSSSWKIFKHGTTIIGKETGYFRDNVAFIINASANNQNIQLPSVNGYNSNAALILSPKDFTTQQLYTDVTFTTPSSATYGLCGSEYLYEEYDGNIFTGGLYSTSSTLDFSTNNSVVRTDILNISGCNLILSDSDFYIDRKLTIVDTVITNNQSSKIVFDTQLRPNFGSPDTMFSVEINSNVRLPDIYIKRASNISGNFIGGSLLYDGTPSSITGYRSGCAFGITANLSGNVNLNDFFGTMNGSISANTFILSGCDYAQSQIHRSFNLKQVSGSWITDCYVNDFTINSSGANVSGINIYKDPFYGKPSKLIPVDEIAYQYNVWTNSSSDNLWTTSANWSLGQVQENHIATFDTSVTSALCIVNADVGSIYGISAKPYGQNWNYPGILRFEENSKIKITRLADFTKFIKIEVINPNTAFLDLTTSITDILSNKVFLGFNPYMYSGMTKWVPIISVYRPTQFIMSNGTGQRFTKQLNVFNKLCGYSNNNMVNIGSNAIGSNGSCSLYSLDALLFGNISLMDSTLACYGTVEKPFFGIPMFISNNLSSIEIPNFYYPFGFGLGTSSTNSVNTLFTCHQDLKPNIASVDLSSSLNCTIDVRNHTKFGNLAFDGSGRSDVSNEILLPNSDFEAVNIPTNGLVTRIIGVNSRAILTNEYLPIESSYVEIYLPSETNTFIDMPILISGSDKILNMSSRTHLRSFSAIGCTIINPWNIYLNDGFNVYSPGIIVEQNILFSGCSTSGSRKLDGRIHHNTGYLSYFEPSAFVLSGNKVEIIETDFISHGLNFSAYSTVTPSAINMNMRGGTAALTSGDARFATDLGNNINWKFIYSKINTVFPTQGTAWHNTVLLSGTDLDKDNIYFGGELITQFDVLTPTSAICTLPIISAGTHNFTIG